MNAPAMEHIRVARNRLAYAAATIGVIGLGLASRKFSGLLPSALGKYPGDALWTLMVFTALAVLRPAWSTMRLTACALVISFAVEFSQLYRTPWLDAFRATTIGHLILGSGFAWHDLIAYTAGAALGMLADGLLQRHRRRPGASSRPR